MKKLLKQALDTVLPPRCIVTGDIVGIPGAISGAAFAKLDFITPPFCNCCGLPFAYETEGTLLCLGCLEDKPLFVQARSAIYYNEASRDIILGFKHGDRMHLVTSFGPWLERAGRELLEQTDFIIPVPLHRLRFLKRRYNQAMVLAASVGKITGKDVIADLLMRVRSTATQGHLKAGERARNVAGAFALNRKHAEKIKGKNILIIDDVYTTGATVKECARVLLGEGVASVNVLTLSRAVKGEIF